MKQGEKKLTSTAEEVAEVLLRVQAVTLSPDKPYTYASGIKSPVYCDNRLLMSYPNERRHILGFFLQLIQEKKLQFDVIAGTESAGIPWAAWLAAKLEKPMIFVRKKVKDHGKENRIEGRMKPGKRVLVIEDLISTGGSSLSVVEAIREAHGEVVACVAIFSYEMAVAKNGFTKAKCPLYALSTFPVMVMVAARTGYIGGKEKDMILEWNKDPEAWGR